MPLIRKEYLKDDLMLGIWKINESSEELKSLQTLTIPEELFYSGLRNETRKKHWLSYRLILKEFPEVLGPFQYDEAGKPFLPLSGHFVSVTHSGEYSGLIISKRFSVGIDIERMKENIERVAERFLSSEELKYAEEPVRLKVLTVLWAAKEAVYKIYGKPVMNFQDIFVQPFTISGDYGFFFARVETGGNTGFFDLHYEIFDDYVMVYAWQNDK